MKYRFVNPGLSIQASQQGTPQPNERTTKILFAGND